MTVSDLHLVDSSGWIEYLSDGPKASAFANFVEQEEKLLVPSVVAYEVCRKLSVTIGKTAVLRFLSHTFRAKQITLDLTLAVEASRLSILHRLAMADAIIYATAQFNQATLVTADLDFQGLAGVVIP